jgi:DnaJ-class molecular chaperone
MKFKDYYKILSVDKKSDIKTIKNAYRKLARKYHPDVNPNDPHAEERFKEINEAYEVLSDPEKRKKYDLLGNNWNKVYTGPGGFFRTGFPGLKILILIFRILAILAVQRFFKHFRGVREAPAQGVGMAEKYTMPPKRGRDLTYPIEITLEEPKRVERSLQFRYQDLCPHCRGRTFGKTFLLNLPGQAARRIYKQRKISVKIPPGVKDSSKVRMAGREKQVQAEAVREIFILRSSLHHKNSLKFKGDDRTVRFQSVLQNNIRAEIHGFQL